MDVIEKNEVKGRINKGNSYKGCLICNSVKQGEKENFQTKIKELIEQYGETFITSTASAQRMRCLE